MATRDDDGQRPRGSGGASVGLVWGRREVVGGGVTHARDVGLLCGRRMCRVHMREEARADGLQRIVRLSAHQTPAVGISEDIGGGGLEGDDGGPHGGLTIGLGQDTVGHSRLPLGPIGSNCSLANEAQGRPKNALDGGAEVYGGSKHAKLYVELRAHSPRMKTPKGGFYSARSVSSMAHDDVRPEERPRMATTSTVKSWLPADCRRVVAEVEARLVEKDAEAIEREVLRVVDAHERLMDRESIGLNAGTNVMNPRAAALLARSLGNRPSLGYPGDKYEMGMEFAE